MDKESLPEHVRLQMAANQLVNKVQPLVIGASLITECIQLVQAYQNLVNAYAVEIADLKKAAAPNKVAS